MNSGHQLYNMDFERHRDPIKSLQIGKDCFAFKPNKIIWEQSKKEVHEWWIKTLLSKRRIYKSGSREIFLQEFQGKNKDFPVWGFSLTYLRKHSEYKYILWKGVYYEL